MAKSRITSFNSKFADTKNDKLALVADKSSCGDIWQHELAEATEYRKKSILA